MPPTEIRFGFESLTRLALACVAAIPLATAALGAQTVRPNPDPGVRGEGYVDYVGHFGEVFKLRGGWAIDPAIRGNIEVITLHPKYREDDPPDSEELFKPKAADFAPKNFARLGLIQLLIIPREDDAFKSLDALREAKIKDLRSSSVEFEVIDDPFYGPPTGRWPGGTFEIKVSKPYLLTQLYTATSSYLCILTAGIDTPPSTRIESHYLDLRYELADWLVPERKFVDDEATTRGIWAKGISLYPFTQPDIWLTWAAVTAIACLFVGILGIRRRWDALYRVSLSLLIFSHGGAVVGGLCGLVFWSFPWFTRHLPASAAVAVLFMPILALFVGRARGKRAHRWALIGTTLWTLASFLILVYYSWFDWGRGSRSVPALISILSFVFYGIGGIIFGALDSSSKVPTRRSAALLFVLLFAAPCAWSQSSANGDIESRARATLDRKPAMEKRRDQAAANVSKTQVLYAYQRVEISGIFSKDDTDELFPGMFDLQIKPSHVGEIDSAASAPPWLQNYRNHKKDLKELHQDAYNQITESAIQAVARLKGKEVNEIVAHSWGTEIVYNAILEGKILPPRRLIVAGMPDNDLAKWKALSRHTGTEVIVFTNSHDPIAGAARITGGLMKDAAIGSRAAGSAIAGDGKGVIVPDPNKIFDAQWENACRGNAKCHRHNRVAPDVDYKTDYDHPSHNRLKYYAAMQEELVLPHSPPMDWNTKKDGPYPFTAAALQAEQDAKIQKETERLYAAALKIKRAELEAADREDAATSGFFDGAGDGRLTVNSMTDHNEKHEVHIQKMKELEAGRAAREKKEADEKRALEFNRELLQRDYAFAFLAEAAHMACVNPGALNAAMSQGRYGSVSMEPVYLKAFLGMVSAGHGISPCVEMILRKIQDAGGRISGGELISLGAQYRAAHPTFLQRTGKSLKEFADSMKNLLPSAGPGDGSGGGDFAREPRSSESGGVGARERTPRDSETGGGSGVAPPPARAHDPRGEALKQLEDEEEVARRLRWGLRPHR